MWNNRPSAKDVAKAQGKELKSTSKEIERDIANLERDMSQLENDIRTCAKRGDEAGARILAKQLIKTRDQKTRLLQTKGHVTSTSYAVWSAASQATIGQAMAKSTMAMGTLNKRMNIPAMQQMSSKYALESEKMAMSAEMMDEVYDSVFDGNEEEESAVMDQIYDNVGLEISQSAPNAPSMIKKEIGDEELDSFIRAHAAQLKE